MEVPCVHQIYTLLHMQKPQFFEVNADS